MSDDINTAFYENALRQYGPDDVRCMGWGSAGSQQARFHVLLANVGNGETVIDVGCGRGDMAGHVDRLCYLGVDQYAPMIKLARAYHPGHTFILGTVDAISEPADWVIGSGIFSLPHPDWYERTRENLFKMYLLSIRGVAVNFLLAKHCAPEKQSTTRNEVDRMVRRICRKREYVEGYLPNDFTLILRRGARR